MRSNLPAGVALLLLPAAAFAQAAGGGGDRPDANPYAGRAASTVVYNVGLPSETGGVFAGSGTNVYDDVTFGGLFVDNTRPLQLVGISLGLIAPAVNPPPILLNYFRLSFYPDHNPLVPGTSPPYSGTPVVAVIPNPLPFVSPITPPPTILPFPVDFAEPFVTLTSADVFSGGPGDRTAGVKIEPFEDAACTVRAVDYQLIRRAQFTAPLVGFTDPKGWFSSAENVHSGEIPNASSSGSALSTRATYLGFSARLPCTPDFNGDGEAGGDADIEAFFACLAGQCCGGCWPFGADFNADGDSGTDQDIEAFFRVLSGAAC